MHDPRHLLDPASDAVRRLARRGYQLDLDQLDKVLAQRNAAIRQGDADRAAAKRVAAEIGKAARGGGHDADGPGVAEVAALRLRAKELKAAIVAADEQQRRHEAELRELLLTIPNLPSDDLPDGDSEEFAEQVRTWGGAEALGFPPADHVDLGERLGILDLGRATKLSGPRFAVLKGAGARLERAISRCLLDLHTEQHGYTEFSVPSMVTRATMTGTGQLPKFEEDLFRTVSGTDSADRELFLIPTAEVPLTNLHAGETLATEDLPLAYTAHTPCFRSEAGSYGRDTRGLIRQHEFSKVELVRICEPAHSRDQLELLLEHAEAGLRLLGLDYRVVKLAAGDIGFSAEFTYDIEVWLPSQGRYREISSVSDFGTFQARRAGIRTRTKQGARGFAATLNGSGLPIGRTLVAILEQNQRADGAVEIPEALAVHTGFRRIDADGTTER